MIMLSVDVPPTDDDVCALDELPTKLTQPSTFRGVVGVVVLFG